MYFLLRNFAHVVLNMFNSVNAKENGCKITLVVIDKLFCGIHLNAISNIAQEFNV